MVMQGQDMDNNPQFIKGLELNKGFYFDIVRPLLDRKYPELPYSAGLMGYGSDVLGYDTATSMDHNWGPRLQLFINEKEMINELNEYFRSELPFRYRDFSVNFTAPNYEGIQSMEYTEKRPVNHLIEIDTFEDYLLKRYSMNKINDFTNHDWLKFTDQNLLELSSGSVFFDGINKVNPMREELRYYPRDICKLRMALLWNYIANKEAFIGRSIAIDDFIGLKINTGRIVNYCVKLFFCLEQKYIPYSKWFGHAFQKLKIYGETGELIINILKENTPDKIELYLCALYEKVIEVHNKNNELPRITNKTRNYFERPYRVIFCENIVQEIKNSIEDDEVRNVNLDTYGYDIILDK